MGLARNYQICVEETPYYHVISRCVRRAFLCGEDSVTGFSYEHRRKWIVQRMKYLAKLFAVDVCAYAVMSNHFHLVLKINSTTDWSEQRVLMTWAGLFDLPLLCERFVQGERLSKPELDFVYRHKNGAGTYTPINNFLQVYQGGAGTYTPINNFLQVYQKTATEFQAENNQNTVFKRSFI